MPTSPASARDDLEAWDEPLFYVPLIDWPISVNKIHALTYGALLGPFIGLLSWRSPFVAGLLALLTLATAFGLVGTRWEQVLGLAGRCPGGHRSTIAILTIRHKPHYFGFTLLVGFAAVFVRSGV